MATEKKITSRIQQKHDVAANWAKATNFIPKKGEIIIYDAEYNASGEETQPVRFKIGDGSKTVNNLPFAVIDYSSDIETLEQKVANNSTAIGALQENTVPKTRKINNKALSSDITLGAADVGVNETTFPGLKKTGTVTGIKMNGTTKNPSSGVVDIGTVLTDASKFATSAQGTKADNAMPKSGGTFTGEVKFGNTENFQGYYIKRMLGFLSAGTRYADLDSSYKDGTWHRMWRLRFPSGSSFWGKIKVTLYGNYSSFNASGVMSKSVTCNFNTSNIYNNVGCYDGLGVNVEQDFRISEAIWNATASAWEILIWQKNLNGNNSPEIMLECWTTNTTGYINAFNGIAAQTVELTQSTSYSAQRASSTGGTKTVTWATLPVYENPLGEEIATVAMLEDKQDKITSSNKLSASLVSGLANVATSGSYNDLSNIPVINQDLTASGFTPVANTYYKHTGTTTDLYTNGVIYFYNGTKYASLDGSGSGGGKTYVYYVTGDGQSVEYDIKHPFGADVNVSVYRTKQSIFGETMNKLVLVDVYTKLKKVKLVFSSAPSSGMKFKVVITGVELENVVTFEEESWANIRKIVLTGNASKHWDIGDTKSITSKSGKTYKIRLADLQDGRYEYSDGSGSSKAVFEFVECYNLNNTIYYRMNSTATNVGGWAASEMRSQTIPTLLADLPDDMVAAMSQVKVLSGIGGGTKTGTSSSNNTLFLPAEAELFDGDWESIGLEESPLGQFDYYKANNIDSARAKYVVDETTMTSSNAKLYWTRSPLRNDSTMFSGVDQLGSWDLFDANYSNIAIAPIFAI